MSTSDITIWTEILPKLIIRLTRKLEYTVEDRGIHSTCSAITHMDTHVRSKVLATCSCASICTVKSYSHIMLLVSVQID